MVRKFIDMAEAAQMLGVTLERLGEMRDRREISAYRDGASWKFKIEEVERLAAERAAAASSQEGAASEFAETDDGLDSILLSERELGESGAGTSSTVIGKSGGPSLPDADIELAVPGGESGPAMPAVEGVDDLAADQAIDLEGLESLDLDALEGIGETATVFPTGEATGGSGLELDTDDLAIAPPAPAAQSAAEEPGIPLASADDDDDLVLGGSGSDVTRSASDSGISLLDPGDSGLSLDAAPLDLATTSGDSLKLVDSLKLDEDDMLLMTDAKSSQTVTQVKGEDDFLLTPLEEATDESDSGSQVISLADSEVDFSEVGAPVPPPGPTASPAATALLEEDLGLPSAAPGAFAVPALAAHYGSDAAYSTWQLTLLGFTLFFLMLAGMMMFDLMRSMWSWNQPFSVNSPLMDMVVKWFS